MGHGPNMYLCQNNIGKWYKDIFIINPQNKLKLKIIWKKKWKLKSHPQMDTK